MASFAFFHCFYEDLPEKLHNLGSDTLKVVGVAAANTPSASSDDELSDITIATGWTSYISDYSLTVTSSSQTSGTYTLKCSDKTFTASGGSVGPFRYLVLYNETATNDELIGYWDYGSDKTLNDTQSFTVTFDATNGVINIS